MVKIRLQRFGTKKRPYYRIVAIDHKKRRDGKCLEILGQYHPISAGEQVKLDDEKIMKWLKLGAQPSPTILNIIKKRGLWSTFTESSKS